MQLNSLNHVLFRRLSAPFTEAIMCVLLLYVESSVLNVHSLTIFQEGDIFSSGGQSTICLVHNTEELYIPVCNIFFF